MDNQLEKAKEVLKRINEIKVLTKRTKLYIIATL